MVLRDALFEIVGVTGVVAVIGAAEDVNPEAHEIAPARMPFDRLRANGGLVPIMVSLSNHKLGVNELIPAS